MLNTDQLDLPLRDLKPRQRGLTILIDNGLPYEHFRDTLTSFGDYIDFVKFGWGTSVVSTALSAKIDCLQTQNVDYFFGGTLFEKFYVQNKVDEYREYCRNYGCKYVEISNGTAPLSNQEKCKYISLFAREFEVFSEVGYKDSEQSLTLSPARWIEYIREDLLAGATKVITEARETGTSGICRQNGEVRFGLIEEIIESNIPTNQLIFEAPNKTLQTYFIQKIGTHVNIANVPFSDVIPLETLRLGLRSDTFFLVKPAKETEYA